MVLIGVDDEIDARLEESCEHGILEGEGDRDDGLGRIGVVLREEQINLQTARGSLDDSASAG